MTRYDDFIPVGLHVISPNYFDAVGTRLLKGRVITERNAAGAPSVFIINETLAVSRRTRELVIRIALGDTARNVGRLIVGQGLN